MRIERTKNAKKGIAAGALLKVCQMVLPFLMRTAMIQIMGVQYLGINSLFSSILHVLNLAELGVGVAMVFSMYEPIAKDDEATICALMGLYRKYYRIIGLVVAVGGVLILPVLPSLVSGDIPADLNIYTIYLMNLGATVLSYWLFAYRNCLLQAHQRNDMISLVAVLTCFIQYGIQFAVLWIFRNYYLYVIVILATQVLNNVFTALVTLKMYPQFKPRGKPSADKIKQINQRVRDLFTGKLGAVVLKQADTIVISSFLGLRVLAIYQNYYFILSSVIDVIEMVLSTITAGLGNSFITETKEKNYSDLEKFTFLLLWGLGVCICCILGLYQPFMKIWVGEDLMLDFNVVICFALYFLVYIFNRLLSVYKDAAGLWHEDRFRPLITSIVNLSLNLLWVHRWGVYGVVLSTVVSMVFVGMPWITKNLFTMFFNSVQLKAYLRQVMVFVCAIVVSGVLVCVLCARICLGEWSTLFVCGVIAVVVPCIVFYVLFRNHRLFLPSVQFLDKLTGKKFRLERLLVRNR